LAYNAPDSTLDRLPPSQRPPVDRRVETG